MFKAPLYSLINPHKDLESDHLTDGETGSERGSHLPKATQKDTFPQENNWFFIYAVVWIRCPPWLYGPSKHPKPADGWSEELREGNHTRSPPALCLTPPAQVTRAQPLRFSPCTLLKGPGDRAEAKTSAHLEISTFPRVEWVRGALQHPLPGAGARKGRAEALGRGRPSPESGPDLTPCFLPLH